MDVQWSTVPAVGPRPRSLHAGAMVGNFFYIFGGYDGSSRLNDLHRLDLASGQWTHVAPANQAAPSPRDRMVAVSWKNDLYIFGGFDGTNRRNDLWKFDTVRQVWLEIDDHEQSTGPSCRHSHSGVVIESTMYILFGYDGNYRSDVFAYDFIRNVWSMVAARGQIPKPRYRSSAVGFGGKIFVFGGHDGTRHLDDLFCFDLLTNSWTFVETGKYSLASSSRSISPPLPLGSPPHSYPPARDSHSAVVHGSSMFVFGGSSGVARNDFWEYRFEKNVWAPIPCSESVPCGRFCHVAAVFNERMYIFAGYDGQHRLGDMAYCPIPDNLGLDCPPASILQDLKQFAGIETFADVRFVLNENETVFGHRIILSRVEYFRALFQTDMKERDQEVIAIPNISESVFRILIEFIYTDEVPILSAKEAGEIFQAADRFGIDRLKIICEQTILASINIENACEILLSADTFAADLLRKKATDFILRHYESVVKTAAFETLAKTNVALVLELIRKKT